MVEISNDISEFLTRPLVGTLATLDSDGSPRTRAIWHDWSEQGLLLFSGTNTRKWQNILNDARVSLCVDDSAVPYKSVILDGTAIRREDQSDLLFTTVLRMAEKYYGVPEDVNSLNFILQPTKRKLRFLRFTSRGLRAKVFSSELRK